MQSPKHLLIGLVLMGCLYSCAVKKYVPAGEYLYRGATVSLKDTTNSTDKSGLKEVLESVLYPEPNSRFLGMYPGLHFHYTTQKEHPGFITRFLNKKIGEKPVYLSDVQLDQTEKLLNNRLENNGFFYGRISASVERDSARKTASVKYDIEIGKPYRLAKYKVETDSLDPKRISELIKESFAKTKLKKGSRFNLDAMKSERSRIGDYLKERGYYFFNSDFILFQADTNRYDDRRFDLYLKLKDGIPEKSDVPYIVDSIEVFPNVSVKGDAVDQDTVTVGGVQFIQGNTFFKPKRLRPFILLEPGQLYAPETSRFTSRRLSSIGTYKYVDIQFAVTDSVTDSLGRRHLKSTISLSPLPQNSIKVKVQGVTKSNNFTGPGLGVIYTNRNIFKGGENFQVNADFGYEKQFSKHNGGGASSLQFGLKTSLLFPRLLFPGHYEKRFRYAIPKTKISVGYNFLNRSKLYALHSFSSSFGYIWRENRFVTHELTPINIDYVKLGHASGQFEQILDENPFLRRSFEQQFIEGLLYSFTYNELSDSKKRGRIYFKFNFDIAGNALSIFDEATEDGVNTFLGLKYAQYVKGDANLSYHYHIGRSGQVLVARVFGGIGIPYGNSQTLPFVKQYFSGGPYSVRAFHIRGLGPGAYKPEPGDGAYFDRAGDIRLEANLEYRFPIYSVFKGALFTDAGNVWLINKNPALPGGQFSPDFINQLGIGAGFGLRIDIQGFVLRFDLAAKLKRPARDWNFEYKDPILNFAIGYPF